MTKRLIIILFLIPFLSLNSFSQNHQDDQLLREIVSQKRQAMVSIPFPGSEAINELSKNVSVSSVKNKSVEIFLSPLTVEWFIQQNYNYEILQGPDSKSILSSSTLDQAKGWDSYPTYTQYLSIMQSFASTYPSLCRLDTIGTTIYGKLVLALKISDNPGLNEDEPETFYTSSMHGNETGGFILMLHLADYLLQNYNTDSRVKDLVDNLQIYINPLANPDGTYGTGDIISSPTRYNADGVDLNRNFPDPDGIEDPEQKETTDMIRFMRSHHFVISANFHSGNEVVNYPWDRWRRLHADNSWFNKISRKYADTVHIYSSDYMEALDNGVTNGYAWYSVNGGRQDFVTSDLHGREVTIELDSHYYVTPAANLTSLWDYNWRSLLGYIQNALYGIHGHVTDKSNGKPVTAKIYINGHDKDNSEVYSDSLSGRFIRLIAPGTWTLEFSAKGYYNSTINDIAVSEGEPTNINVEMIPILNAVDTIATPLIYIYPDPAREFVRMVLPERQMGNVNVRIFSTAGKIIADYQDIGYEDAPLVFETGGLASGLYSVIITNMASGAVDKGRFVVIRSR